MNFFSELKRRNVYKVAVAYAVVGWLLIQIAIATFPVLEIPNWATKLVIVLVTLGFPIALVLAWAFEATAQGIKRTEDVDLTAPARTKSHAWIYIVVIGAAISVALFLLGRYTAQHSASAARTELPGKSIAVLPFINMSADKADEYLSDGMTEELLNVLAKVPGLRVPGRSSSFAFKDKIDDNIFRKVGEQLHVSNVLEGSVRKAGDKLRVTAQLIDVADGFHIWSETYDAEMKDILKVQSDVAQRVVKALQVKLGLEEERALAKRTAVNPEAHRLYLLGRFHFSKYAQDGWANATNYYNQALQLDPNYALAYCGLADTYGWLGGHLVPGKEAWAKEKELAEKALALDPDLADAHLSLEIALASILDWEGADRELKRAIELNPNAAFAYDQYAWLLTLEARFDEAIAQQKKAVQLDPFSPLINGDLAWVFYNARRYDESITAAETALKLDRSYANARHWLALSRLFKGQKAEAIAEFEKTRASDDIPWYVGSLGYAYAVNGERAKAERVLAELEEAGKKRYVSPGARAIVYLGLGEKKKALDWLEKAFAQQDVYYWYLKVDPLYDSIRNEPRFQAMQKKVGLD